MGSTVRTADGRRDDEAVVAARSHDKGARTASRCSIWTIMASFEASAGQE